MHVILASASPRRAQLLRSAGIAFEVRPVEVDESTVPGESPSDYVLRLAQAKAERGAALHPGSIVLGADTTVVACGEILVKPVDDADGANMLRRLSGRDHEVLTGVSVRRGEREAAAVETTIVRFAALTEDEIAWYVGSGEGRDKAGGYAIQGLASRFITRIEGSYSNVVGLPLSLVYQLLKAF